MKIYWVLIEGIIRHPSNKLGDVIDELGTSSPFSQHEQVLEDYDGYKSLIKSKDVRYDPYYEQIRVSVKFNCEDQNLKNITFCSEEIENKQ